MFQPTRISFHASNTSAKHADTSMQSSSRRNPHVVLHWVQAHGFAAMGACAGSLKMRRSTWRSRCQTLTVTWTPSTFKSKWRILSTSGLWREWMVGLVSGQMTTPDCRHYLEMVMQELNWLSRFENRSSFTQLSSLFRILLCTRVETENEETNNLLIFLIMILWRR